MQRHLFTCLFALIVLSTSIFAQERQPVVKLSDEKPNNFCLKNVHLVASPTSELDGVDVWVKNGKIEAVGKALKLPEGVEVREMKGAWVYPAWIDAYTELKENTRSLGGFDEEENPNYASNSPLNLYWNDAIKAHFRLSSQNGDAPAAWKDLRNLGFGVLNVVPNDGIVRGSGYALLNVDGKLRSNVLNTESCAALSFNKGSSKQMYPSSLMGAIALLRQFLYDAATEAKGVEVSQKHPNPAFTPNLSLAEWNRMHALKLPLIFETNSWQQTLAAQRIAAEHGLQWVYKTKGDEYKRIEAFKNLKTTFIVPLNFPKSYDIKNITEGREIALERLKAWEQAPTNPALLEKHNISFALTANGLKAADFYKRLQQAIELGLSQKAALQALTTTPAKLLGIEEVCGTLEKDKLANMLVASGNIFDKESKIFSVYVKGNEYEQLSLAEFDIRGDYFFAHRGQDFMLKIKGDSLDFKAKIYSGTDTNALSMQDFAFQHNYLQFSFKNVQKQSFVYQGIYQNNEFFGTLTDSNAVAYPMTISKIRNFKATEDKKDKPKESAVAVISPVTFPNKAYGFTDLPKEEAVIFTNVTVWTNTKEGVLEETDVLIDKGKIVAIGKSLKAPKGARVIDGAGKHLTPGIIDEHSHIAIMGSVNEYSHSVTAEVRIGDVVDCEDINIYRQLAGGVTAAQLLHGSANPIGGQCQVIKLRWGSLPEEMKFQEAKPSIKFALGENVKQSNAGDRMTVRYPQTRMGVEQLMEDVFLAAKDYKRAWEEYEKSPRKLIPPKKDLQLETLLEILEDKRDITCHSYVQSEIVMLMRLAERTGFKVNTFTHILEGYKIADKMKVHGANASTFADWWAYKYEVMEATPYNAALMAKQGLNVCVNSDDAEMGRRLNQEAAKGIRYGGMSEEEALKMVTLNPAKALGVDKYVGSIEKGKQADVVLWTDNPLSIYAKVAYTFIDGKCYFDHQQDQDMQQGVREEKARILHKMLQSDEEKQPANQGMKKTRRYHCDDVEEVYWEE